MKRHIIKYCIPHADNNYHPHMLHTKRTVFYGTSMIVMKAIVIIFALLVPSQVYMLPDIVAQQAERIISLTNNARTEKQIPMLFRSTKLETSAQMKAVDMADKEYFDHTAPNGTGLKDFLSRAGYQYSVAGENLAMGFTNAADVIAAWERSESHYANLIDSEYEDIGVSIAPGTYKGIDTVYIAQHFGTPKDVVSRALVQGERIESVEEGSGVSYDEDASQVSWESLGKNQTALFMTAIVRGDAQKVEVVVRDQRVRLTRDEFDPARYVGQVTLPVSVNELFKVITVPTAYVTDMSAEVSAYPIHWESVAVVSPTPMEKYTQSKQFLGGITNIFSVSKHIYLAFFSFFAVLLLVNIAVEVRKQHPHVIAQTVALLMLIVVLVVV